MEWNAPMSGWSAHAGGSTCWVGGVPTCVERPIPRCRCNSYESGWNVPPLCVGVNLTRVGGVPMQAVRGSELSSVCGVLARVGLVRMVRCPLG